MKGVIITKLDVDTEDNITLTALATMHRYNEWDHMSSLPERLASIEKIVRVVCFGLVLAAYSGCLTLMTPFQRSARPGRLMLGNGRPKKLLAVNRTFIDGEC